ncbi:MAG: sortase [Bacillota bacterium]|nr:sortase [Bacillota bacterium]
MHKFLSFFSQFHRVAFLVSGILLVIAASSAYQAYTEGDTAQINAEETLGVFEQLVLKTDETEPRSITEPLITIEKIEGDQEVDVEVEDDPNAEVKKPTYSPIAKIQIDKIGLSVSVLSEWSYELLDISVNKFSGPEPNEPGNFIVIGHNYINKAHFGSLKKVEIGDLIKLTDLSGRTLTYEVFEVLIIKPNEVEKLESDNPIALTLVTCDTNNEYRLVVKSKASESQ